VELPTATSYFSLFEKLEHFYHVRACATGRRTVVAVCKECNMSKSDKELKELRLQWVRITGPDNWNSIVDYNKEKGKRIATAVRDVRASISVCALGCPQWQITISKLTSGL
jgi:hypothetical protein